MFIFDEIWPTFLDLIKMSCFENCKKVLSGVALLFSKGCI